MVDPTSTTPPAPAKAKAAPGVCPVVDVPEPADPNTGTAPGDEVTGDPDDVRTRTYWPSVSMSPPPGVAAANSPLPVPATGTPPVTRAPDGVISRDGPPAPCRPTTAATQPEVGVCQAKSPLGTPPTGEVHCSSPEASSFTRS